MGLEFYFNYDSTDKSAFEVAEVGGNYGSFIECSEELMKGCGLWSSFVAQYRSDRPTLEDSGEEYVPSPTPPTEEEMEELYEFQNWGPSALFDANELRQWAERWIIVLDVLDDDEAKVIFPCESDLHRKGGVFGRNWVVGELKKLIEMAECAMRHNVGLTMSSLLD